MGLEPAAAAELLKAADPDMVKRIAAELAYIEASGDATAGATVQPVREFVGELQESLSQPGGTAFLRGVLADALGQERAREILQQVPSMVDRRDPFLPVRSAEPEEVAEALTGESPQVAGLVLAELPSRTSARVLSLLDETVRAEAVRGMASERGVAPETRLRVASVVRRRLEKARSEGGSGKKARQRQLRKVAVLLRDLGVELRQALLGAIAETDPDASSEVQRLMVMWEDLRIVADRSLQEALRHVDARRLALATYDADEAVTEKLRTNMSERLLITLDEEISLLGKPTDEEIEEAREELLKALRELAENNLLAFEEG